MTTAEEITLREFLQKEIAHERELREQSDVLHERALAKQAVEYERRLEDLNHAHERAIEDRAEYVQQKVYDLTQRDFAVWKSQMMSDQSTAAIRLEREVTARATTLATNQRLVNWLYGLIVVALAIAQYLHTGSVSHANGVSP